MKPIRHCEVCDPSIIGPYILKASRLSDKSSKRATDLMHRTHRSNTKHQMWRTARLLCWLPVFSLAWEPAACRDRRIKTEPTQFYWSTDTRTRPEVSTLRCESPHWVLLIFSSQHAIKGNDNHTLCPANCWCPPPDAGSIPSACAQPGVRWDETLS